MDQQAEERRAVVPPRRRLLVVVESRKGDHLAGLLEIVGIFGLSISLWSRWPAWAKLMTGYATLVCYIGVILSGSRGGYLATVFSLVVFAILSLRIMRAAGSALSIRLAAACALIGELTTGLISVMEAPQSSSSPSLSVATAPPPTITTGRFCKLRQMGK